MDKIKAAGLIVAGGMLGVFLIQLAAPILFGILVQGTSLAVPILAYHLFVQKKWRIRLEKGAENFDQESSNKTKQDEIKKQARPEKLESIDENEVRQWYETVGRIRIRSVLGAVNLKGGNAYWIRRDGICSMKTEKGYRRVGMISDYPGAHTKQLLEYLKGDGIHAEQRGKYLYLHGDQKEGTR